MSGRRMSIGLYDTKYRRKQNWSILLVCYLLHELTTMFKEYDMKRYGWEQANLLNEQ